MLPTLAFLGTWELVVISIVALLLFGKRLPEVARSMGRGIVEFKRGLKEVEAEVKAVDTEPRRKLAHPTPRESAAKLEEEHTEAV